MGHERSSSYSPSTCDVCDSDLEPVLGDAISPHGIYREVEGYRCPNADRHEGGDDGRHARS